MMGVEAWAGRYNVVVHKPACIAFLLLTLAACRSFSPPNPTSAGEQKKAASHGQILVGDELGTGQMIRQPRPVYPTEAKRAHIEGVVKLAVVITKAGDVGELHLISGNPVLVPAAIEAVRQWRYAPFRLNGEPVEIKTQVDVPFTMSQ